MTSNISVYNCPILSSPSVIPEDKRVVLIREFMIKRIFYFLVLTCFLLHNLFQICAQLILNILAAFWSSLWLTKIHQILSLTNKKGNQCLGCDSDLIAWCVYSCFFPKQQFKIKSWTLTKCLTFECKFIRLYI